MSINFIKKIRLLIFINFLVIITVFNTNITAQVLTPEGKPVPVSYPPESPNLIAYWNSSCQNFIDAYSLIANIIGNSSSTYNCHAYAWILSEGGPTCWLNAPYQEYFWTDQNYANDGLASYLISSEADAVKVSYTNSDHSATKVGNSGGRDYISKWGSWPLVSHQKAHDPYYTGTPQGFLFFYPKTDHSGVLGFADKTWVGGGGYTHTLTGNVTVPYGIDLTIKSGATVNFNGYGIIPNGGTINIESGATVNYANVKYNGNVIGMYGTIQSAIDHAVNGLTIELQPTAYNETVNISNRSTLTINGAGSTTINSLSINNSDNINIDNLTVNGIISSNYGGTVTILNVNFAAGGGIVYDYSSDQLNLGFSTGTVGGAAMGYTSYNGAGNIFYDNITGWDGGVYLNNYASYNVATNNSFCENGYDIYAQTGAYAYASNNDYSRSMPGAVYGNVFVTGRTGVCSGNSLLKSKSTMLTGSDSQGETDEAVKQYLQLLYQNSNIKGVNPIGAEEFKSGIKALIDVVTERLEATADKESFKKNINLLRKLYNSIDSKNEFYKTLSLLDTKKFGDYYPYIKRFEIKKEIESKNYINAGAIAEELLKLKNDDADLTSELLYEKGLLNKYYLKNKDAAVDAFSAVIAANKEGVLAGFAKNELNGFGSEKVIAIANKTVSNSDLSLNNYPNPFNPSTKINFTIAAPGNVKLSVYNMLGQKVTELINEYKEKGSYTVQFDASRLSSGVYIYTLQAGGKSVSNKMFLLK